MFGFAPQSIWGGALADECAASPGASPELAAWVYDGDSLRLDDGRKLRLIGLDTPELGRDGAADRAGASVARDRLEALLETQGWRLRLQPGVETHDRYGRLLAHLYLSDGRNLTRLLLSEGLGMAIAVPPNLTHLDCYLAAERQARQAQRGLWRGDPVSRVEALPARAEGFHLVRGRIGRVGNSRRSLWLNLDGGLALRIDRTDLQYFPSWEPRSLPGRELEVRGWIYRRKGERRMQLRHPGALRWLDD